MTERFNAQKEIESLDIMTNNGFNTVFGLHKEQTGKVEVLTSGVDLLKHTTAELKRDVSLLKVDVSELKVDVAELKADVAELKTDVTMLKNIMVTINEKLDFILENMVTRHEFQTLVRRTERLEVTLGIR